MLDGALFPLEQPLSLLRSGRAKPVPLMIGNCAGEAFRFVPEKLDIPPDLYKAILENLFLNNSTEVKNLYPCPPNE
jgi:carboxylesterase type B